MIAIVDCGLGNLGSIRNMLKRIGAAAAITAAPDDIRAAERLILPGVGAFDEGMTRLRATGLLPLIEERVLVEKTPILGICLGMQLLTERSEEGELPGLGWIEGETIRFRFNGDQAGLKIPHMRWNTVAPRSDACLFSGTDEETRYYFVHSYHVVCAREDDVLAETTHGFAFTSALRRGNIFGTQFHPEKSHRYGMRLLRNFVEREAH